MYYVQTQILFWIYWLIVVAAAFLVTREMFRTEQKVLQITAALTIIPLLLRAFLIK